MTETEWIEKQLHDMRKKEDQQEKKITLLEKRVGILERKQLKRIRQLKLQNKILRVELLFQLVVRFEQIKKNYSDDLIAQQQIFFLQCYCLLSAFIKIKEYRKLLRTNSTKMIHQITN